MPKFHADASRNREARKLYAAWIDADNAWMVQIKKAFPRKWPGDVRYTKAARGEPGSALRRAYDANSDAEREYKAAGGIGHMQSLLTETRSNPRRKKKKAKRHVRRTRKVARKRTGSARITFKQLPAEVRRVVARASTRRRRKTVGARRNPAAGEFVVEAYKPKGHKFYYYESDERLTTVREHATRFRERIHALAKAKYIRDRVPAGIEWVRVCPA